MFIPQECIGYHIHWMSSENNDEFEDMDETVMAKVLVSVHHEYYVENGKDIDGLRLLDFILDKISHYKDYSGKWCNMSMDIKKQRRSQLERVKTLVRTDKLGLIDALCILFTKEEMSNYGI